MQSGFCDGAFESIKGLLVEGQSSARDASHIHT